MMQPGPKNLITDVPGLLVGNAQDEKIKTGVTVLTGDKPLVTSYCVMGGAPGTRETDLLAPDKTIKGVDALVLSGGSAFGLDAVCDLISRLGTRMIRGWPFNSKKTLTSPFSSVSPTACNRISNVFPGSISAVISSPGSMP